VVNVTLTREPSCEGGVAMAKKKAKKAKKK
jgi:hypothetical protein